MDANSKIEAFRKRISDVLLLAAMIVSIPAAGISAYRMYFMEFKLQFIADVILSILLILGFISRRRLDYNKRMFALVIYLFFVGVLSIHTWGLFGFGTFIFFFSCIMMTILYGLRWGISLFLVSFFVIAFYSFGVYFRMISWDDDFNSMSNSTFQWIFRMVIYSAYSSIAIIAVGLMNRNLRNINYEIAESESRFRSLYENANDAIFILKNTSIFDCNPKTLELFRCTKAQIIGQHVSNLSPRFQPDDTDSEQKAKELIRLTQDGQSQLFEWRHIRFDNSYFDVEVSLNSIVINEEGYIQAIARDISERKLLEQKILNAVIESEEKERLMLAGDLHDEVGPLLSSINMYLSLLEREETSNQPEILEIMQNVIKETIGSVREISNNLSPHVLNTYGLAAAINVFIESKKMLIDIFFEENIDDLRLHNNLEPTCYRIIKELINNTLKYAHAKSINLKVDLVEKNLSIIYSDDGVGFNYDEVMLQQHSGMGLLNIINRLNTIKANYNIRSKPNEGFNFDMRLTH